MSNEVDDVDADRGVADNLVDLDVVVDAAALSVVVISTVTLMKITIIRVQTTTLLVIIKIPLLLLPTYWAVVLCVSIGS